MCHCSKRLQFFTDYKSVATLVVHVLKMVVEVVMVLMMSSLPEGKSIGFYATQG